MHKMFCSNLLHQVYPVVDGGPVEKRYVFFVWLPNVKARLHQLSAALEDAVPAAQAGARSDTSWVSIDYRIAQFDICFMETRQFDIKKTTPHFSIKCFGAGMRWFVWPYRNWFTSQKWNGNTSYASHESHDQQREVTTDVNYKENDNRK